LRALAADSELSHYFRNSGDQVLAAHQLLAELAVIREEQPGIERSVVVVPPAGWRTNAQFLGLVLNGLASVPTLKPTTVDDAFTVKPFVGGTKRHPQPLERDFIDTRASTLAISAAAVNNTRATAAAIGSTLPPGTTLEANVDRQLLVAESADLSGTLARSYLAVADKQLAGLRGQVLAPDFRSLTLTARAGEIPLTVQNQSNQPRTVIVRLESDKLEFPRGPEQRVELLSRNTTVRFAVRARTSGSFSVTVSLRTPTGDLQLDAKRFTVRSTAASGVGLALSIGAAVFLLAWWGRHILRGRRAKQLLPTPSAS
jgi:hypothetical protein